MKHLSETKQMMSAAPIVIIGTVDQTVNFTTVGDVSVAGLSPPLVTVSLHEDHYSTLQIMKTEKFSINIPETSQMALIDYCSKESGHTVNKSLAIDYEWLDELPAIKKCPVVMSCKVHKSIKIKTRVIIIAEIMATYVTGNAYEPVLYTLNHEFHTLKSLTKET